MKHLVIVAHPRADSFNLTLAHTWINELRGRGHAVVERDLYRLGFDPGAKQ